MKYLNSILIGFIALLIIGTGVWFFFFKTPGATTTTTQTTTTETPTTGEDADKAAISFYQWYLGKVASNLTFSITTSSEASKWVSEDFIQNVQAKQQTNTLYSDPVFLSSDYQADWAQNVSAKVTRKSATESVVLITLGGAQPKTLSVRLIKSDNTWRVDSVSRP